MRAAVLTGYDKNGRGLELRELPTPEPSSGEVLVKVSTAGVNPLDDVNAAMAKVAAGGSKGKTVLKIEGALIPELQPSPHGSISFTHTCTIGQQGPMDTREAMRREFMRAYARGCLDRITIGSEYRLASKVIRGVRPACPLPSTNGCVNSIEAYDATVRTSRKTLSSPKKSSSSKGSI